MFTLFKKNKSETPKKKKSILREWLDALVFAGIAALIIRTFIIEAFMIPTSSMEQSLLVGDFLFVSKFHYGARMPMAPLSIPFIHNKLPGTHTKSYIEGAELPYWRLPGITSVQRNDVVVFNFPADDVTSWANDPKLGTVKIPSMKENYIKRCVGIPGDTLSMINSELYVNGKLGYHPPNMQKKYLLVTNDIVFNEEALNKLGIRLEPQLDPNLQNTDNANLYYQGSDKNSNKNYYVGFFSDTVFKEIKQWSSVVSLERYIDSLHLKTLKDTTSFQFSWTSNPRSPFSFADKCKFWNVDNFGPIVLPQKGVAMKISIENIDIYKRCIQDYEHNELKVEAGKIFINGKESQSYTFQQNYYFMMGDNRYNSLDSRFWGMVPEDHIVGKPILVFFSTENGIRWNRFFKSID